MLDLCALMHREQGVPALGPSPSPSPSPSLAPAPAPALALGHICVEVHAFLPQGRDQPLAQRHCTRDEMLEARAGLG